MSLHLGNLSSRIRRDDLERVFRRFGRCTIQVKDKYGFVVYDYPASAEKALKNLHGKRICGESITLSWSNRQPRALHRFARGGKAYEPTHKKYSVKENRRLSLNSRRDHKMDSKQADGEGRKFGSSNLVDESTSYHPDNSKGYVEERVHLSNDRHELGGAGKNHLEDDRWGEQVVDPSSENCLEYSVGFDRYEPYHSDDKNKSDKRHSISPLTGSPTARKSEERRGSGYNDSLEKLDYPYYQKSQKTCYMCGEVGHKMHKCPFDLKRHKSRSQGRLLPGAVSVAPRRHEESDMEPFTSLNYQKLLRHGGSPRGRRKDFSDKKRNRKRNGSQDKSHVKRAMRPSSSSSSFYSDYTSSRSQSPGRSLEPLVRAPSRSKSKSVTLKRNSLSSLRSSTSRPSGSKLFESQPVLRSMSPAFSSLPAELDRRFSPSPNKKQTDFKDSMVNAVRLAHCQGSFEGETMVRSDAGASRSENITAAMENECEGLPKLEEEEMKINLSEKDDGRCHSVSRGSVKALESYVPQPDDDDQTADNLFLHTVNGIRDSQSEDLVREQRLGPEFDISLRSSGSNSVRISTEELCMVLKHYGLQYPEETEKGLPVEIYFGSARSWPWEIIYYRRLKKGPISAENYARRISQNEEFGIVDKYIRGSSGWSEMNEGNP